MSNYISKDDYKYQVRTARLDQILEAADEDEEAILNSAELEALGMIEKHLSTRYDMASEFAKTGTARHKVVLRWAKVLVIYYIYERIPDELVPERVVKNYDDVMKQLEKVEDGEASIPGLAVVSVDDPNNEGESKPFTKRRWGSQIKRANDAASPNYLEK